VIELTDEMVAAYVEAWSVRLFRQPQDQERPAVRAGLAAVLAIVEGDRPNQYLATADILARLPKLLHEAREARGLSMRAVADELCVAPSTVHQIETGEGCHLSTAVRVLFWLGLDHSASNDQAGRP
jgi:ribosome-binding protein aMBF1 (putative translation factor)